MNEHESEFEDPGFKAAVRRTVGREAAPPSLRAKVESLLATEAVALTTADATSGGPGSSPAAPAPRRPGRLVIDRNFWRTAAAAACVLIALSFMAYQIREQFFPPSRIAYAPGVAGITVPEAVVVHLTRTHDNCSRLEDHHKIPGDNPEALREKLTAGAGVTASTISLGADWKFKGAGICAVGDKQAAHLLFVRADEYVSIFSMLAPEECGYSTEDYAALYEKHPVAGFRQGSALYCVVASSSKRDMSKDELNPVLDKMRTAVASGCVSHETMMATASAAAASTSADRQPHP